MTTDLDTEFAMRFALWAATLGTAIIAGHWAWRHTEWRMACTGIALKAFGWSVHQFYWFQSWISFQSKELAITAGDQAAVDYWQAAYEASAGWRWITVASEFLIIFATVLLVSVYLEARVGRFWPVAGIALVGALFGTGYAIGFPR